MADKSKENMVKARLLVLTKMFYELTDENHPMDTFEIIDYLGEHGVPANTKTLRSDIKLLNHRFGYSPNTCCDFISKTPSHS